MLHNCCALLPEGSIDLLGNVIRGPVGLQVHHLLRIVVDHLKRGAGKDGPGRSKYDAIIVTKHCLPSSAHHPPCLPATTLMQRLSTLGDGSPCISGAGAMLHHIG